MCELVLGITMGTMEYTDWIKGYVEKEGRFHLEYSTFLMFIIHVLQELNILILKITKLIKIIDPIPMCNKIKQAAT